MKNVCDSKTSSKGNLLHDWHHHPMPPNPSIRALRSRAPRCVLGRRFASHEAPQYNEPTGWIFSEKVCCFPSHFSNSLVKVNLCSHHHRVRSEWERIGKSLGILGCLVLWLLQAYCITTSQTQGETSYSCRVADLIMSIPVYNHGP